MSLVPFCYPTQDPTLYYIVMSHGHVQPVTVTQSFLVFHGLDTVGGHWRVILQNVPQLGLSGIFSQLN